ncbi:MAG TPA: hypothetical protein VMP01_09185 [Pirellulaceae bacterium]|nr:hypothetical protein [Pirellulaceae bacterium]
MTLANRLRMLLVGQTHAPELAPAVAWLQAQARCETMINQRQFDPDAIVFCVARPGQISRAVVEDLHRAYPLSPLIALVGPWCEGEVRSGKPWPGVTRIYWHQWPARLPQELARLTQPAAARMPRSATEVDAIVSRPAPPRAVRPALIGVVSRRQTDFEAIAQALDAGGHHPVWISAAELLPVLRLDGLIIDGEEQLALDRFGPIPQMVLANFPRPEELAALRTELRLAVLAKPYAIADLLDRLSELLASSTADSLRGIAAA